jgi:general secretion pathway protein F
MTRLNPIAAQRSARPHRNIPSRVDLRKGGAALPAKPLSKGVRLRRDRISGRTLALVTRQLATLIRVMTVEEALRTIALQTEKASAKRLLLAVHAGVVEGYRLSDAMARQGAAFPSLYRAMIAAGESSGALPDILDRLADLLEREQHVRSQMLTTLIYPAALSITAVIVIIALMTFVVPRVVEQFTSMGQTLPLLTRIVIFLSTMMTQWGWLVLLAIAAGVWAGARALHNPVLRLKFDGALLRVPVIGRLIRDLNAARLARTLATMIASGLPVIDGLVLTARTINNRVLRAAVETMASAIREGGSLSAAMRRAAVFPPVIVNMAASGESSGKLDTMLSSAADYLEREFNTFTSVALSLLEPIIIIVMGAIVATIVLAILLPILQINTLSLR